MSEARPGPGGPEAPAVPRNRLSKRVLAYGVFGVLVVLGYLGTGLLGLSFEEEDHDAVPLSVRQTPGGYRSYHLWHSGYQGGK